LLSLNSKTKFYDITTKIDRDSLGFKQAELILSIKNSDSKFLTYTSSDLKFLYDIEVLRKCLAATAGPLNEMEFASLKDNMIFSIITNSGAVNFISLGRSANAPISEESQLFRIFKLIDINLNEVYIISKRYEICSDNLTR